ncbi:MAG TPA: tail fiber domain-containing protein [Longimicrobium sp.]|nr:tail fiber domain-containing protein [Longimicrobium sp.]
MTPFARIATATAAVFTMALGAAPAASAQSDILLQLRSGSPAGDRFRVDSAGGVVAIGRLGFGIIPASGAGVRLMWHPFKGAFRAGEASASGEFDDANVGFYSWAGGSRTIANAFASFSMGDQVEVTGTHAAGFGSSSQVRGTAAFSAGASNRACGFASTTIGFTNTTGSLDAGGDCGTGSGQGAVALGYRSTADADYAIAIGQRASANGRTGAIVLADASTTDSLEASANNQFSVRAAGGYRFFSNATETSGVTMAAGGGSFNTVSDRNRKELFEVLDGEEVLARIRAVPVTSWSYLSEGRATRHIGPMAQDWHAAFRLSSDSLTINSGDFDGVNLLGIQALERRTTAQAAQIAALGAELAVKTERIETLEARIARLEALLAPKP